MTLYQRIEQLAVLVLSAIIAIIVLIALWNLTLRVVLGLVLSETFDPTNHAEFQIVFGAIFTVIIALEFKRSILIAADRRDTVFQVRTVVLIALLAILRKFIILDLEKTDATKILALSLAAIGLGAVYWLIRHQDYKSRDRTDSEHAAANSANSAGDEV